MEGSATVGCGRQTGNYCFGRSSSGIVVLHSRNQSYPGGEDYDRKNCGLGELPGYRCLQSSRNSSSSLVHAGTIVKVIMTEAATRFIAPLTFQTLTRQPVVVDVFAAPDRWEVAHVSYAQAADLILIAPAANMMEKLLGISR